MFIDKNVDFMRKFKSMLDEELKPAQPKIIKSGETWVAEYDGVDYLCIAPDSYNILGDNGKLKSLLYLAFFIWKPISEIEITDLIAKLRPILIHGSSLITLYGVVLDEYHSYVGVEVDNHQTGIFNKRFYRLATVKDLMESQ